MKHYVKRQKLNESVFARDDEYVISGIVVKQSLINSYTKKVKDETGKNIKQIYSEVQIAEELVRYIVAQYADADKIPSTALIGGAPEETPVAGNETAPAAIPTETAPAAVAPTTTEDSFEKAVEPIAAEAPNPNEELPV